MTATSTASSALDSWTAAGEELFSRFRLCYLAGHRAKTEVGLHTQSVASLVILAWKTKLWMDVRDLGLGLLHLSIPGKRFTKPVNSLFSNIWSLLCKSEGPQPESWSCIKQKARPAASSKPSCSPSSRCRCEIIPMNLTCLQFVTSMSLPQAEMQLGLLFYFTPGGSHFWNFSS